MNVQRGIRDNSREKWDIKRYSDVLIAHSKGHKKPNVKCEAQKRTMHVNRRPKKTQILAKNGRLTQSRQCKELGRPPLMKASAAAPYLKWQSVKTK